MLRDFGRENRWVCYNGIAMGNKISAAWFFMVHYQADLPPNKNDLVSKSYHWEKHLPNLISTNFFYTPQKNNKVRKIILHRRHKVK